MVSYQFSVLLAQKKDPEFTTTTFKNMYSLLILLNNISLDRNNSDFFTHKKRILTYRLQQIN